MPGSSGYVVDPDDPRAPSLEEWARLGSAERQRIMDQLPSEVDVAPPPEGDLHRIPKQRGLDALDAFFRRTGRRIYLSSELPVYYPEERMFAPDLIAVRDVDPHERMRWVVAHEGKGLDFALEVTVEGSRKKDLEDNVARYARLGIPEYFVFDRRAARLHGFRLDAGRSTYSAVIPREGRWRSEVLELELGIELDRFRFYAGSAVLPETRELLDRANHLVDDLQRRMGELEENIAREQLAKEQAEERAQRAEQQRTEAERQRTEAERRSERIARKQCAPPCRVVASSVPSCPKW
jgi:Uma2 family endonuclease